MKYIFIYALLRLTTSQDEREIKKGQKSVKIFLKGMAIVFESCTGKALFLNFEGIDNKELYDIKVFACDKNNQMLFVS
jgi:hypothetical protein